MLENATQITELARWGRGVITDIDLSLNGQWLAVAAGPAVYIHNVNDLRARPRVVIASANVSSISISPDGAIVALAAENDEMQIWQLGPRKLLFAREGVWAPQFSPDGGALGVIKKTGIVILSSSNGEELAFYANGYFPRFKFSSGGSRVAI